jgi:5'-3' exonuclease
VPPTSIPDYLAVVGDSANGSPGLPGWGAKSSAAVLARYEHLEAIPKDWRSWGVNALNPRALSEVLRDRWDQALPFRHLATLRNDMPLFTSVDELHWTKATDAFPPLAARFDAAVLKEGPSTKRK